MSELYRISPLGVIGTFGAGLAQGGFYATGGLFAARSGLDVAQTSLFVMLILLGGVLAQWPVGALSDRFDRRRVLTGLCLAGGVLGLLAGLLPAEPLPLLISGAVFGALLMPIYSLSIAHTNDYLRQDQIVAASGSLILIYGVGSVFGPLTLGQLIERLGPVSYFTASGAFLLGIAGFALYRMTRRAARPVDEQSGYRQVSPGASIASATLYSEEEGSDEAFSDGSGSARRSSPTAADGS